MLTLRQTIIDDANETTLRQVSSFVTQPKELGYVCD